MLLLIAVANRVATHCETGPGGVDVGSKAAGESLLSCILNVSAAFLRDS